MPRVARTDGFDAMKKLLPALALLALCASVWVPTSSASAVPKMNVKIFVGVGSTTFKARVPEIDLYSDTDPPTYLGTVGGRGPSTHINWGGGLSARVRFGKIFTEIGLVFSRFSFNLDEELQLIAEAQGNPIPDELEGARAQMNSLEIPMLAGYVPYRNPYFKLFLYGGLVNEFNIRGFIDRPGTRKGLKFKPKDIPGYPMSIYVAGARFGTQFDLGPLNFDLSYTISMNSATATTFRTNTHVFKFFLGWLF